MASADVVGVLHSYGLTSGIPVEIDTFIDMLSPMDLPLQNGYVHLGSVRVPALPKESIQHRKIEWQTDEDLDSYSLINGAITNVATTVIVDDGSRFLAGDVIAMEAERATVTSVSTDTLTIVRGQQGTTAVAHNDNVPIFVVGTAMAEGSDAIATNARDRDRHFNYSHIFGPHEVRATGTEQIMPKYGLVDGGEYSYQIAMRAKEAAKEVERSFLYSVKWEDSATKRRTMGGFDNFITTNADVTSTSLTTGVVATQLQAIWEAGGNAGAGYQLMVSGRGKRQLSVADTNKINLFRTDMGRGEIVEYLETDFGRTVVGVNRYLLAKDAFLFTRDQVTDVTVRPWVIKPLSTAGDYDRVAIIGEKSMKFKRERHAAKFTNLTTVP